MEVYVISVLDFFKKSKKNCLTVRYEELIKTQMKRF